MSLYSPEGFQDELGSQLVPDSLGNYIGPHWSNGKFQESVEWGDKDPRDELDLLAYYHDSAYARYKDELHRAAADRIFAEGAHNVGTTMAAVAAELVSKGNMTTNAAKRLISNVTTGASTFGPLGAVAGLAVTAVQNVVKANDRLPGGKFDAAVKEVQDYYKTDPHKRQNMFNKLSSTAKEAVAEVTLIEDEYARIAKEKPKYEALVEQQKLKNAAHATWLQEAATRRRGAPKLGPEGRLEPIAEVVNERDPSLDALWKPVSHKVHQELSKAENAKIESSNAPYFSGFGHMFKRKKKKKKNVVHVLPADLANRQAERFQNFSKLKKDAVESLNKPVQGNNKFWYYGPGQTKIDKQMSDLRRKMLK